MSKESSFNPTRLTLARRRRGFTKRGLAEAADVGERTIVAYERSDRVPSENAVQHLAKVLGFPTEFFFKSDIQSLPETATSFRSMSRMTAAERDRAIAGGTLALELHDWIQRRFDLPNPDVPDLRHHARDPEAAAMALRTRWSLGDAPISNLVWLLEAKGIRIFSLAEDTREVDAFSFWRSGQPFVFLNTKKSSERSRFDAAHELGHLVLHQHGEPSGRQGEQEADAFASAFLMPRSSVLAFAPRVVTIQRLIKAKHHWRVSVGALARRLHDVGMVSEWQYRTLAIEIQQLGFRTAEPESCPREMSQIYHKVFGALLKEGVSRTDVARELGMPVRELDALVFQLVLASSGGGNPDAAPSPLTQPSPLRLVQ